MMHLCGYLKLQLLAAAGSSWRSATIIQQEGRKWLVNLRRLSDFCKQFPTRFVGKREELANRAFYKSERVLALVSKMVWTISARLTVLDRRPNSREQDWRSQVGNLTFPNLTLGGVEEKKKNHEKRRKVKIRVLRTTHLIVRLEFALFAISWGFLIIVWIIK